MSATFSHELFMQIPKIFFFVGKNRRSGVWVILVRDVMKRVFPYYFVLLLTLKLSESVLKRDVYEISSFTLCRITNNFMSQKSVIFWKFVFFTEIWDIPIGPGQLIDLTWMYSITCKHFHDSGIYSLVK